jgi:hypothetical protein
LCRVENELRNKIWAESAMTVTYLSSVMSTKHEVKSPYELLYGTKPVLNSRLKMFGEVGVVTTKDKIQAKLTNRGTTCIFVGYTKNHSKDVFRMLKLETKAIIHSRDIIWLHKMHKDWVKEKSTTIASNENDPIELPIGMKNKRVKDKRTNVEIMLDERNDTNVKVFREMKKLESWFNPQANQL